jgi:hypothetical protein
MKLERKIFSLFTSKTDHLVSMKIALLSYYPGKILSPRKVYFSKCKLHVRLIVITRNEFRAEQI